MFFTCLYFYLLYYKLLLHSNEIPQNSVEHSLKFILTVCIINVVRTLTFETKLKVRHEYISCQKGYV